MRTHFRDSDPSSTGGNKVVRTAVAASLVGLMALAGCSGDNAGYRDGTISTPTTAAVPEIATPKEAMLSETIAEERDKLAHEIIALARSNDSRYFVKTLRNTNKGGPVSDQGHEATTIVTVKAGKVTGEGDYGEYNLIVDGALDPDNGQVDPSKASSVMITMDTRKNGEDPQSSGNFYSFEITPVTGQDTWHVVHRAATKGNDEYTFFTTEPGTDGIQYDTIKPLSLEQFKPIVSQAETVLAWATDVAPINYAPAQ